MNTSSTASFVSSEDCDSWKSHSSAQDHKIRDDKVAKGVPDIHPEKYLNESELAVLRQRHTIRRPASTPRSDLKVLLTLDTRKQQSDCWLKSNANAVIQEWLARKNKEHCRNLRILANERKKIKEESHQRELKARERNVLAQESFRDWVSKKKSTSKHMTKISIDSKPLLVEGIKSPNTTLTKKNNETRKKNITYSEWLKSKPNKSPKKSTPLKPREGYQKRKPKKSVTYEEWLAAKSKQTHEQIKMKQKSVPDVVTKLHNRRSQKKQRSRQH